MKEIKQEIIDLQVQPFLLDEFNTPQRISIIVNKNEYVFEFTLNDRNNTVYMNIRVNQHEVQGIPLRAGVNLVQGMNLPVKSLFCLNLNDINAPLNPRELGDRSKIIMYQTTES